MALADRFHHTMRVVRHQSSGAVIEGQRDEVEVFSGVIRCLLTTSAATEQPSPIGRRTVSSPILLCAPTERDTGVPTAIGRGSVVEITAPVIHAAEGLSDPHRYEVEGRPQPLAKPGSAPMGFNATLTLIED